MKGGAAPPHQGVMLKLYFSCQTAYLMTRKDSEKDSERPHYYSQFWLDVAAGRRVIGTPKLGDEEASELELPEVPPTRRGGRVNIQEPLDEPYANRLEDNAATAIATEEYPELEEEPLAADEEEQDLQDSAVDDIDIPDMDLGLEEEDEEDFYEEDMEEEEEEEEEEDIGWGGRGRKKTKPGRQTKQPKKPGKRDRRSGY